MLLFRKLDVPSVISVKKWPVLDLLVLVRLLLRKIMPQQLCMYLIIVLAYQCTDVC